MLDSNNDPNDALAKDEISHPATTMAASLINDHDDPRGQGTTTAARAPSTNPSTSDPRRTIERNNSSDSYFPPPPPEVAFLKDVDVDLVSDGSIVFNYSPMAADSPSPTRQQLQNARKDRFPSFDSMASSGSVVLQSGGTTQAPAAPKQPSTPSDPEILPYHRRKQQRQQQQQQSGRDETPPRPEKQPQPSPNLPPPPPPPDMEPPHFLPQFVHSQGGHPHQQPFFPPYPPPPPHYVYPPSAQTQNFPFPPGMPPPYGYAPYPPPPPQEIQQMQQQQQQMHHHHHHHQQKHHLGKHSKKESRKQQGSSSRTRRTPQQLPPKSRRDHFDSYESLQEHDAPKAAAAPPRPQRRSNPPPPPPPPAPVHVRNDSMGSVSSLGSIDRSTKEEGRGGKDEGRGGFFDRLNPWHSPRSKVDEFHRKNQEFLSRVDRPPGQFSPSSIQRRVPLTSMDRPPPSMGNHRRLNSIENDDWTEPGEDEVPKDEDEVPPVPATEERGDRKKRSSSTPKALSGRSDSRNSKRDSPLPYPSERTSLLPPPGISSNEYADVHSRYSGRSSGEASLLEASAQTTSTRMTERMDNTTAMALYQYELERAERERVRRKKRKKKKKRRQARRHNALDDSSVTSSSSESSIDFGKWVQERAPFLEQERERFIEKWKQEARKEFESKSWTRRLGKAFGECAKLITSVITYLESFFANLPLTIGAIALSTANLGVDWFKFCEENLSTCQPVHFHSKQCTFPEFPGCFYCDTSVRAFKIAEYFHFGCSCFAGMLALSFVAKLLVARRVVFDELSSPTTASPAGLFCMTLNIVFAGRGMLGMIVVTTASCIHLCLAIWFIYTALAYHIMPEPSWFPNTTGIGISAVKTWLYHPMAGHFLMAISLTLNFFLFPISLVRVFSNRKISATVGWMQMSAPNVSLYALTIMAQPSFEEENPDINSFQRMHRLIYLPIMHFLFGLCILGMLASVTSLWVRWNDFKRLHFSPAHAAFCAPCLSHANAVQAYRAAVNSFSGLPSNSAFLVTLYFYWVFTLVIGSFVTIYVGTRFLSSLPKWTHLDLEGEIEPPEPHETEIVRSNMVASGDAVFQSFVSPAILQANETGTLVLTRDAQGRRNYRRTRKTTALGFEPIMNVIEMEHERSLLLDWVSTNAPRRRNRTLSVPGIDFSYGSGFGTGNSGVYDMEPGRMMQNVRRGVGRSRSNTLSPVVGRGRKGDFR